MDDKKLLFIYNPRAGKGQIRNNLLDIIDTFVKAGYVVTACRGSRGACGRQNGKI